MQIKTLKKSELLKLLENYPDDTRIEITVTSVDLKESKNNSISDQSSSDQVDLYTFGLPGDYSYDPKEKVVAFQVWSQTK